MHHVISMPELLNLIFSFSDKKSNCNNVSVCRRWYDSCLPVLWYEVSTKSDFNRLFNILGITPTRKVGVHHVPPGSPFIDSVSGFGEAEWTRFILHAKLIRVICSNDWDHHTASFETIAHTRPVLNLFPNLHTLEWKARCPISALHKCALFTHTNVKRFNLTLGPGRVVERTPTILNYISRMSMLEHLDIDIAGCAPNVLELEAIKSLERLKTINLPPFNLSTQIIEALSYLPNLLEVKCQELDQARIPSPIPPSDIHFSQGAFRSLRGLWLTVDVPSTILLLNQEFFPSQIQELSLAMPIIQQPTAVHELLEVIANKCPMLEAFSFNDSTTEDIDDIPSLTLKDISPILSYPRLKSLKIRHSVPLALEKSDIEVLASSLTPIECLCLNELPVLDRSQGLPLDALLSFARHCPRLKCLGLLIDATLNSTTDIQSFHTLQRLSMGYSNIEDYRPVVYFLAKICPLGCEVESEPFWGDNTESKMWAKVNEVLPLLVTMRTELRKKEMQESDR